MGSDILSVAARFRTDGKVLSVAPLGEGHINGTYLVKTDSGKKYALQRINTAVFKRPEDVMSNIRLVLSHLRRKILASGGNPDRECLTVVEAESGKDLVFAEDGGCYRMYVFVEGTAYQTPETPEPFYRAAKAFGTFQRQLSDFPASSLAETIPHFHDTPRRLENLEKAIREDKCGRVAEVQSEIAFARARRDACRLVVDAIAAGEIPLRVTHNDTKLNNVLLDGDAGGFCVIDLDTVMPSFIFSDFGDFLRSAANTTAEDDPDLNNVSFNFDIFKSFTKGYLKGAASFITPIEIENLPFATALFPYMTLVRFIADYINGDIYFHCKYPEHNLVRSRNQLKLTKCVEAAFPQMEAFIDDQLKKLGIYDV